MFGQEQLSSGLNVCGYPSSRGTVQPLMMMYGVYAEANNAVSNYSNQARIPTSPVRGPSGALPHSYFQMPRVRHPHAAVPEEEYMEDKYEVHDGHLKAPVIVLRSSLYPTMGSRMLFTSQQLAFGSGYRNSLRICDAFHNGRCVLGDKCHDIHVHREYLEQLRLYVISWIQNKEHEFNATLQYDLDKVFRVFCADLKEVVEVPISALRFTKGLYVDPSQRARHARGGHSNQFSIMASQVPTACGLFLNDPPQCKWGRWCNQVHIDQGWMMVKKSEFEAWSKNLEKRFNELPSDHYFAVHDPQLKIGLSLPKACIAGFSRGLFQGSTMKAPSVCMLFQRHRCTAGSCCNQIHVIPEYLHLHRQWVQTKDQLPESRQSDLSVQMNKILEKYSNQFEKKSELSDISSDQRYSTQEVMSVNSSKIPGSAHSFSKIFERADSSYSQRTHHENFPILHPQSTHHMRDEPVSIDGAFPLASAPVTSIGNASDCGEQQHSQTLCRTASSNEFGESSTHNPKGSSTTALNFGDIVMDTDERSQSSFHASQTTVSQVCKSNKHTNNPYTLGGSTSCSVSPRFGWVQPVPSGCNSITTNPIAHIGGMYDGPATGNGAWGMKSSASSTPAIADSRAGLIGLCQHDFDASLHISSVASIQWNVSSSQSHRPVEEPRYVAEAGFGTTENIK